MGWYGWNGWWMGWMGAFWIVLIVVVVWLVLRGSSSSRIPAERRPTPEDILRERFARGEIDAEEYQRRLEVLRRGTNAA